MYNVYNYTVQKSVLSWLHIYRHNLYSIFIIIFARKLALTARVGQAIAPNAGECTKCIHYFLKNKINP